MKYHGNYCGPNWSAGIAQPSVSSDVPSIDEFDETCRIHDAAYANNADLLAADTTFVVENFGRGVKRSVAAAAVGVQAAIRAIDKFIPQVYKDQTKMTKKNNMRGPQTTNTKADLKQSTMTTVPAAYGYTLKMQKPVITRRGNTATISGSDYAGTVQAVNNSSYQPSASVFINPAYFQNAMLGSQARTFEKFRIRRGAVTYIPAVPTSTQGQLIMLSTSTVKEPFLASGTTTFLGRALSQHNAVATPIWKEATIELSSSSEWSIVDSLIDGDLDDCIAEEVQVYSTCDSTVDAGILVFHYEIEFKDPLYVYHPTVIPVPNGNGAGITLTDNSGVNATTDVVRLNNPSTALGGGNNSIYRLVFQQAKSTLPTGPGSWAAVASVIATSGSTTTSTSATTSTIAMASGTTLYGVYIGTDLALYASYDTAAAGGVDGAVIYQTATTATGTWAFLVQLVRLGDTLRITTQ